METKQLEGRDYKRELFRKYFDYTCRGCGKVWEEGKRRFDIHHPNEGSSKTKIYDSWADLDNVILLCHQCHLNLKEHREAMSKGRIDL